MIKGNFLLQRMEGKGGWTYTVVPRTIVNKSVPFGWIRVRGNIDSFELKAFNLMPIKGGDLFLPVKAEIRKQIKKEAGDYVSVTLYIDDLPLDIPEELKICLETEPQASKTFYSYTDGEQKAFVNWIYSAKRDETKVNRIAKTIEMLLKNQKFYGFNRED